MCKEMNAPVLPESKKVNATATHTYDLSADYNFLFDSAFTDAIQMNQYEHDCLCQPSTPMVHYCCPGCRGRTYTPTEEDRKDLKAVLVDYDFAETKPEKVVEQLLELIIRTLPLSMYTYGKSHQSITTQVGVATLFFADIASAHRFAGHLAHACEDYYYHEEYLHTLYHGAMYDADWSPITATHAMMGRQQMDTNRLHKRLMMGYLGGGVGAGYVGPRNHEILEVLEKDKSVETCRGVCGVYLASGKKGWFGVKRLVYVPHEPIVGEVVKWSSEWIGDAVLGEEDDDDEA
ncbi:hypothetical protein P167DRAFT_189422 [Morchella conica CCBAS932]|uniref:Uncharacterized protein n=1 Tax=Morchella conica CCBAS932 TaxID=1392247 RepID=A0A3N4L1H8_9PEZI|nr:hypothetical protein P167DRAFT_189422 [Morchella conica CCBAS932]